VTYGRPIEAFRFITVITVGTAVGSDHLAEFGDDPPQTAGWPRTAVGHTVGDVRGARSCSSWYRRPLSG